MSRLLTSGFVEESFRYLNIVRSEEAILGMKRMKRMKKMKRGHRVSATPPIALRRIACSLGPYYV
jgi:hypothetical protein